MAGATAWLVRHRTSGWAVSGLLLLLGGLAVLTLPYPRSLSTAQGYRETSGSVVVPAVVRDLRNMSNGRGGEYWVDVRGPAPVSGRIELDDPDPVLSRLSRGDHVGVLLWHGRRTGITFDGRVQEAVTAPTLVPGLWLAGGLILLHGAVFALHAAGRTRRPAHEWFPPRREPDDRLAPTGKVIAASAAAACLAGVVTSALHQPDPLVYLAIWLPVGLVALVVWRITCRLREWRSLRP